MTATVGVIMNARAGKDIRRLAANAPAPNDATRAAELRRVIAGAHHAGAERILVAADHHRLVERVLAGSNAPVDLLELTTTGTGEDSTAAARAMAEAEVDALVVSGGDGTHRDVARGWRNAPIVALAAGTNNAFPQAIEPTIAGAAAGLVSVGAASFDDLVAYRALVIDVEVQGRARDLALVSAAVLRGDHVGGGNVWGIDGVEQVFAAVAEPWSIGLSALAGVVAPTSRSDDRGVLLDLDPDTPQRVTAPTAPGYYVDAGLRSVSVVDAGQPVAVRGPAMIAVDGDPRISLEPDEWASMTIRRNGPHVIDIRRTFSIAVRQGRFYVDPTQI